MEPDVANFVGEVPERFVPDQMKGELSEAEHLDRYWWAASLVGGQRVLDAGCGLGYGSAILARSGAREVVGIDIAGSVLEAARPNMPPQVVLRQADMRDLPFGDGAFDTVVCFEAIEHVEDPMVVLDELSRVIVPGGTLAVSSPNRGVYVEGNPHHHHEFEPAELKAALEKRFENVTLFRQQAWITSAILDDDAFRADDQAVISGIDVRKVCSLEPGSETYTLAVATDGPPPFMRASAMVTHAAELKRWLDLWDQQQAIIRANIVMIAELQSLAAERGTIRNHLYESEQELSGMRTHAANLEATVAQLTERAERAETRVEELHARADEIIEEFRGSASWRLTKPLRDATTALKRALRP